MNLQNMKRKRTIFAPSSDNTITFPLSKTKNGSTSRLHPRQARTGLDRCAVGCKIKNKGVSKKRIETPSFLCSLQLIYS